MDEGSSLSLAHCPGQKQCSKALHIHSNAALLKWKSWEESSVGISIVDPWTPSSYTALKALLSARLCSAIWGLVGDCDETYNYWEPTHYLLYGKGFQTWEYSPVYALRSYAYLLVHLLPGWCYAQFLQDNRMLVFFFMKCLLAVACSLCELYFYRGVCKEFGANIGRLTLGFQVFAAGMFISATALLPSSFAMYMTMLSMGAWYQQRYGIAIFTTAVSALLGWPFAALIGAPIAFDILFRKKMVYMFFMGSLKSAAVILIPMVFLDSKFYGRFVVAPVNIVLYNVFTSHGPDLYGTEPWHFYFINGFLNFNFVFLAALLPLPLNMIFQYFIQPQKKNATGLPLWLSLLPLYAWLLVFLVQPHKEERFLFPVYPLICLAAAVAINFSQKIFYGWFVWEKKKHYLLHTTWIAAVVLVITSLMGVSRTVGQYRAYRAPMDVFLELQRLAVEEVTVEKPINVCLGREWHRFPSSFFLPKTNWNIKFIESEFRGQLPKMYANVANATSIIPEDMNDMNYEEVSRYVALSECHYLIDTDRVEETAREPRYAKRTSDWIVKHTVPFLDASKSPQLLRAFYVPWLTEKHCTYVDYNLFQAAKFNPSPRTYKKF
ncbi:alpha-1,2-mannosyltransferase ALG9-like isoform X2 [Oratosquilla oratoria]|uniref:alpha-1,2-mannosyltransferase ALG9-like isoform X2 n=1 Tax=Oratosquilla oratoria TaxID=337810 RepID=UPI003F763B0F